MLKEDDPCPIPNCNSHRLIESADHRSLYCPTCRWQTNDFERLPPVFLISVAAPDCTAICAVVSCPNYDKEAEKSGQCCSTECAEKAVAAVRSTSVYQVCGVCDRKAKELPYSVGTVHCCSRLCFETAKVSAKLNKDKMGVMNECPQCKHMSLVLWTDGSYRCGDCRHKLTPHTVEDAAKCIGGTFTLEVGGVKTEPIPHTATKEETQEALAKAAGLVTGSGVYNMPNGMIFPADWSTEARNAYFDYLRPFNGTEKWPVSPEEWRATNCIVCGVKPCDGKSRYCSPECHIVANGGAHLLSDRYCPEKMCSGRPPMVREEDTVTGTSWRCACGRVYLCETGDKLICVRQPNGARSPVPILPEGIKFEEIEQQEIVNGLQFSVVPQYELIPREAMLRLIKRAELGQKTKGKNAWNALSINQENLNSKEALVKRLGHAIDHCYKLINRIVTDQPLYEGNEDDAAALMWAGMYACCATKVITESSNCLPTHSPSKTVSQTTSKESSVKQPSTEGNTPLIVL